MIRLIRYFWESRAALWQFYINHKLTVFCLFVLITVTPLLFSLVYLNLAERNVIDSLKSRNFYLPLLFLIGFVVTVLMLNRTEIPPPDNGKICFTVAKLGNTEKARNMQESIEAEVLKWLSVTENLSFRRQAILEMVTDQQNAEKYARKRGIHFILYGNLRAGSPRSPKLVFEFKLGQGWPLSEVSHISGYTFSGSFDPTDSKEYKRVAKDIVIKIIRLFDDSVPSFKSQLINRETSSAGFPAGTTCFKIGNNFWSSFQIGDSKLSEVFLAGLTREDGTFSVSGRLFDSDGLHKLEIQDNEVIQTAESKFFAVIKTDVLLLIQDSCDRTILEVKKFSDSDDLPFSSNDSSKSQLHLPNLAQREKKERNDRILKPLITVKGEMYGMKGRPLALFDKHRLLRYSDTVAFIFNEQLM